MIFDGGKYDKKWLFCHLSAVNLFYLFGLMSPCKEKLGVRNSYYFVVYFYVFRWVAANVPIVSTFYLSF